MERKFWKPSLTTQHIICPIPFNYDTYKGCVYDCTYCFARDKTIFARRNSDNKKFTYLVGNRIDLLSDWIDKTLEKDIDYNKPEEVALKERIPLKIGANSDPFPPVERRELITYGALKLFGKLDYPLEVQTKNPAALADYADEFDDPNWVIAVTLISIDQPFLDKAEPGAPTAKERLLAIERLTRSGKNVMIKCQPAIYPKILDDLPALVKSAADAGCFAMNMEGLKVTAFLTDVIRENFDKLSAVLGYDVIEYYHKNGYKSNPATISIDMNKTIEYLKYGEELAHQNGIKFFVADNNVGSIGDSDECCGTEVLRNYRKWCNNTRTKSFGCSDSNCSVELGNCIIKQSRTSWMVGKTLDEIANESMSKTQQDRLF